MHALLTIRSRGVATALASRGLLLLGAVAAAAVLAPVAQADTASTVRAHVRAADAALHQLVAAGGGSTSGPLAQLESQLSAAGSGAAKLYRSAHHAHKAATSTSAAKVLTSLAAQENRDTTTLTPLLGQLGGTPQTNIAGFIAAATQGREQVLSLITQLLGQLPAPAQSQVAGIVAQLSNAGAGQPGQLAGAISPGSIACPAIDAISTVIGTVLTSVQADLARVLSLIPFLPAGASDQLTGIVNGLPGELTTLLASIAQAFNCPSTTPVTGATTGSTTGTGSVASTVGSLVSSIVAFVQKLLSAFVPGITAGQTPTPVTSGAVMGLPSPMSFIPNFASFFGGGGSAGSFLAAFGF